MMLRVFTAPVDAVLSTYEAVRDGDKVGVAMAVAGAVPLGKVAQVGGAARKLDSVDDLSEAASALDQNGLTHAGRALQKNGNRPGSAFPQVAGHQNLSRVGQDIVDDILTAPGSTRSVNRFGGVDIVAPGGRGVRYDADANFMGFLEPNP